MLLINLIDKKQKVENTMKPNSSIFVPHYCPFMVNKTPFLKYNTASETSFFTAKYTKETQRGYEVRGERYEVSGADVPQSTWVATAHREADEREYHPLLRVLQNPQCTWAATSAGDADAVVRWDFCPTKVNRYEIRLLYLFIFKQKSTEESHEYYPAFKIINMNGRLYDPVIGRFFSPDNYVQLPEFTQGFNRYSYCLNNPLKYVDPTGMIVEYNSFGDRVRSFFMRIFDKEYRNEFRELKKSDDTFVLKYNNEGMNTFTYDGNKTFLNYSLTEEAKQAGNTKFSLMRHETHHGLQLLHGELGFENKPTGNAVQIDDEGWKEITKWKPVNYDVYDELDAHTTGYGNFTWKAGTDRDKFNKMNKIEKLEDIRGRYSKIEQNLKLNNSVDEKVKNDRFYMYPYLPKK